MPEFSEEIARFFSEQSGYSYDYFRHIFKSRFKVSPQEYLIDIRLLYLSSGLLRELRADAYSKSCYNSSKKLSHWCNRGIIILIITTTTLNIGQILFASFLYNIDFNLHLPVFTLILSLTLMAITRLLYQGKTIKEDNDLFV